MSYKEILRTDIPESVSAGNARTRRFENLLHYLEHGFCLPEWERPDFDLYEELRKYMDMGYGNRLFPLMEHPHVLARLFTRLDSAQLEKLFSVRLTGQEPIHSFPCCSPTNSPLADMNVRDFCP